MVVVGRGGDRCQNMENIVSTRIILKKNRIKIIKKIIRPRYGRLVYPYCQARLSHRLLLNKKMSESQTKAGNQRKFEKI